MAIAADGDAVIAWTEDGGRGGDTAVVASVGFGPAARASSAGAAARAPDLAAAPDGRVVGGWVRGSTVEVAELAASAVRSPAVRVPVGAGRGRPTRRGGRRRRRDRRRLARRDRRPRRTPGPRARHVVHIHPRPGRGRPQRVGRRRQPGQRHGRVALARTSCHRRRLRRRRARAVRRQRARERARGRAGARDVRRGERPHRPRDAALDVRRRRLRDGRRRRHAFARPAASTSPWRSTRRATRAAPCGASPSRPPSSRAPPQGARRRARAAPLARAREADQVERMRLTRMPAGAEAELRCKGKRCPIRRTRIFMPGKRGAIDVVKAARR